MSAPIKAGDSSVERISKLLPADITAAFLSVRQALVEYYHDPLDQAAPIFWMFVVILVLAIPYFYFQCKIRNAIQIVYLCLSYSVFALTIANTDFMNYLPDLSDVIKVTSIALPIIWTFLITNIFNSMIGIKIETRQIGGGMTPWMSGFPRYSSSPA